MSLVLDNMKVFELPENKFKLQATCPLCHKVNEMVLNREEYTAFGEGILKFNGGALIQDAFPTFSPRQREFLLTGNCSCMWG